MSLHDSNLKNKKYMILQQHIPQDQELTSNFILLLIRDAKDISAVMDDFDSYSDDLACRIALIFLFPKNIQKTHTSSLKNRYV